MNIPRLLHGVGLNDADYTVHHHENVNGKSVRTWICPFYRTWQNMLSRCYAKNIKDTRPSYLGCSVCDEWLIFSNFRAWMIEQPWVGNELDKDHLVPGNKVYGPEFCVFISGALNSFLTSHLSRRGKWPIGVDWKERDQKFQASCANPFTGKRESLGYFSDPNAAHEAWRKRKHQHACAYSWLQDDNRVAKALRIRFLPDA